MYFVFANVADVIISIFWTSQVGVSIYAPSKPNCTSMGPGLKGLFLLDCEAFDNTPSLDP